VRVPNDTLAWTREWYVREETLPEANSVIVNHHHRLELAKVFGAAPCRPRAGSGSPPRASR